MAKLNDLSGQGHNMDTVFGTPTIQQNIFNGLPALSVTSGSGIYASYHFGKPYAVFTVGKMAGTQNARLVSSQDVNWLLGWWGNGQDRMHNGSWLYNPSVSVDANTHLYAATSNTAGSTTAFYDLARTGGDTTPLATGAGGASDLGKLQFGGYSGNNETSNGWVGETLVYNRALSQDEITAVSNYLNAKWRGIGGGGGGGTPLANALMPDTSPVSIAPGAILDVNGVTETIGPLSGFGTILLGSGAAGALTVNSTVDSVFSGAITGNGTFGKIGPGTLTLTVDNTAAGSYTGATTVSAGKLLMAPTGKILSTVAVNSGGTLAGTGVVGGAVLNSGGRLTPGLDTGTPGTLTAGTFTINTDSVLDFEFSGGDTSPYDSVNVIASGGLTVNGGTFHLYQAGGTNTFSTLGVYDLFQYTGADPNFSNLPQSSILNRVSGVRYGFGKRTEGADVFMALTLSAGPVWNGGADPANNNWSDAANWSTVAIQTDDSLRYDGNTRLRSTNDQTAVAQLRSFIFLPTAGSDGAGFTVDGNGVKLIGDFDNNLIRNDSPVAQTINLPITVGAADKLVNTTNAAGNTILGGKVDNNGTTLLVTGAGNTTISETGTIVGAGGLTKSGAGTMTINAATSYSGDTRIAAGTLAVGHQDTLQNTIVDMNAADSGSLTFGVPAAALGGLTGARNINLGGAAVSIGAKNVDTEYKGALSGAGSLIKEGSGKLTLSGTSSYTNGTTLNSGTLQINGSASLGAGGSPVTLAGGTLQFNLLAPGLLGQYYANISGYTNPSNLNINNITLTQFNNAVATYYLDQSVATTVRAAQLGNTSFFINQNHTMWDQTTGSQPYQTNVENFVVRWTGNFVAPVSGNYTFSTGADDVGVMWIDNNPTQLCTNGGSGTVYLSQGAHPITLAFQEFGGGDNMYAYVTGPSGTGLTGQAIPNSVFTYQVGGSGGGVNSIIDHSVNVTGNATMDLMGFSKSVRMTTLAIGGQTLQLAGTAGGGVEFAGGTALGDTPTFEVQGSQYLNLGAVTETGPNKGIIKTGAGRLLMTTSSYTGPTTVQSGSLNVAAGGGLSTGSNLVFSASTGALPVLEQSGTFSRAVGSAAGQVRWLTSGGFAAQGGTLAVQLNGGTAEFDWGATIGDGNSLVLGSATADNVVDVQNGINLGGAPRAVHVLDNTSSTTDSARISGTINGAGGLTKAGPGMLALAGNNTFSGGLSLAAGTVQVAHAGAMNAAAPNPVSFTAGATATLQLKGISVTIGGLSTDSGTPGSAIVENAHATPVTLTVDKAVGTDTFAGILQDGAGGGKLGLTKAGAGTLALTGANTFTGPVNVTGGTLQGTTASLPVNLAVAGGANLTLSQTTSGVFTKKVSGAGSLTKAGSGTVTLATNNNYTGATIISEGTLKLALPAPVSSGLDAWYDASTLSLADGAAVTAWADRSGNGRDLVTYQGTPNFKANAINGLPAINFQNESLQNAVASPFFAKDVYLVFRSASGNTNFGPDWGAPIGVKDGDDNNRTWMFQPGEDRFWGDELPAAVARNGNPVASTNNFELGADVSQYMVLKVTAGPNNGTQVREYIVGSRTDAWSNSYFDTAEILAFNRALTSAEESLVGGYLATKYGIATSYGSVVLSADNIPDTSAVSITTTGATLDVGGTIETVGPLSGVAGSKVVLGNGVLTVNSLADSAFSGVISGSGGIVKKGFSTLTLDGSSANTYTGSTKVLAGTVAIDFANMTAPANLIASSSTLVLGGGTLRVTGKAGATSSQTFNGATLVQADSAVAATSSSTVNLSLAAITRPLGATLDFSFSAPDGVISTSNTTANGILGGWATYTHNTWAKVDGGEIAPLTIYSSAFDAAANVDVAGGSVSVPAGAAVNSLRFNAPAATSLSIADTLTLASGGVLVTPDVVGNSTTIGVLPNPGTLQTGNSNDLVLIQNNTLAPLTINAVIADSGTGGVTKSGPGDLVLAGNNTFTGPLRINGGKVSFASPGAALTYPVVFGSGSTGILQLLGQKVTLQGLGSDLTSPGSAVVENAHATNTGTIEISNPADYAFAGVLRDGTASAAMNLVKSGSGTLILSGNNTLTGTVTINDGVLQLGSAGALNATAPRPVAFGSAGTLRLSGNSLTVPSLTGSSAASYVENQSDTAATLTVNKAVGSDTFAGVLRDGTGKGVLGLTKSGAGTLALTSSQLYTGPTAVGDGTLAIGAGDSLPALATSGITLANSARVTFNHSDTSSLSRAITGTGGMTKDGSGTLTVAATQTYDGETIVKGGTLKLQGAPAAGITFAGTQFDTTTGEGQNFVSHWRQSSTTKTYDIDGNNVLGSDGYQVVGNNTRQLLPSYVSAFSVNGSIYGGNTGYISIDDPNNPTSSIVSGTMNGGTRNVFDFTLTGTNIPPVVRLGLMIDGLDGAGWNPASIQIQQLSGGSLMSPVLDTSSSAVATYRNRRPDWVFFDIASAKAGDKYSVYAIGGSEATVQVFAFDSGIGPGSNPLPTNTPLLIAASSALDLNGGAQQVASLSDYGGGGGAVTNNGLYDSMLTIGGSVSATFSGVIGDGAKKVNLTRSGSGTQTLTGANTYTGVTKISGGILSVATIGNGGTSGNLGAASAAAGSLVLDGGALQYTGATAATDRGFTITAGKTGTIEVANAGTNLTVSGAAASTTGSLAKIGPGTLTLTGANAYSGTTNVNGGTLSIGDGGAGASLGSTSGVTLSSANITFNHSDAMSLNKVIGGTGTVTKDGSGTLTVAAVQTYDGATVITGGTLKLQGLPLLPTANLQLALTASDGVVTSGSTITQWNDFSGNGRNAVVESGRASPTYSNGIVNFASSQCLRVPMSSGTLSSGFTLFVVAQKTGSNNANETLVTRGTNNLPDPFDYYNAGRLIGKAAGWKDYTGTDIRSITTRSIVTMAGSSVGFQEYLNSTTVINSTVANANYGDGSSYVYLGTRADHVTWFTGNMEEVLLYSGVLSAADRQQVWAHLNAIWGTNGGGGGALTNENLLPIASPIRLASGATLDLAGVNQQIASLADQNGGGIVTNSKTTPVTLTLGATDGSTAFSGAIEGGSGKGVINLVKDGASTQILTGANTYAGSTTVKAGTLRVDGELALVAGAAVNVKSGATLGGSGTVNRSVYVETDGILGPNGSFTVGDLSLANGSVLDFSNLTLTGEYDSLLVQGDLAFAGTTILQVPASLTSEKTYTLFTSNENNLNLGNFSHGAWPENYQLEVANDGLGNPRLLNLVVSSVATNFSGQGIWKPAGNGTWNNPANWDDPINYGTGVPGIPGTRQTAVFNTVGGGSNQVAVDLEANLVNLASLQISGATGYTIGDGSGAVVMDNGAGTAAIQVAAGAAAQTINVPVTLASDTTVTTGTDAQLTISQAIDGSKQLTKAGDGLLILSGTNGYTGGTAVTGGTLVISSAGALPSGRSLSIGSGGSIPSARPTEFVWTSTGSSDWAIPANWGQTTAFPSIAGNQATFGNTGTTGSVSLGADRTVGRLVFNTSVGTTLSGPADTLRLNNTTGSATITAHTTETVSHTIATQIALDSSAALSVDGLGSLSLAGDISDGSNGAKGLTKTGDGLLILSGTNSYSGGTAVTGGTLVISSAGALPSGRSLSIGSGGSLIIGGTRPTEFVWTSTGSSGWATPANWGQTTAFPSVAGNQATFGNTGTTGSVSLGADRTVGRLVFNTSVGTTLSGPADTLRLNNTTGSATITAHTTETVSHTIATLIALDSSAALSVDGLGSLSLAGDISDGSNGAKGLTKTGDGLLILSGTNGYSGGTAVTGGTLVISSAGALPSGRSLSIGSGGTLILGGGMAMGRTAAALAEPVPEPGTLALLAIAGLVGLLAWRRKK